MVLAAGAKRAAHQVLVASAEGGRGAGPARARRRLVLASTSPYRRELLARLGLPFEIADPGIDEQRLVCTEARARAAALAHAKAAAVTPRYPDALIIGSDQVAALAGTVLDKPGSAERAVQQLCRACGRALDLFTAVSLIDSASGRHSAAVTACTVHLRALPAAAIRAYVARERPLDCAGSFRAEGLGIALFERIETPDPSALIGLPLIALTTLLSDAGLEVLGAPASA